MVAVGLLAGLMLGTGMQNYTYRALPQTSWVLQHQAQDALFRRVMPTFFNLAVLALIATAVANRGSARWFFAAAALLGVLCIGVTIGIEVPMNRLITSWTAGSAPSSWAAVRDRWLWFHLVRTLSGIGALVLATVGLARIRLGLLP